MFQQRFKAAMLRIALQLGKQNNPLSLEFWDLSRKTPKPDTLTIEMIKAAEIHARIGNEIGLDSCRNVVTYLKAMCI